MRFLTLAACMVSALSAQPAISAIISFDFTARIDDPNAPFAVGTPLAGSFSYDNSLAPSSSNPFGVMYDNHPSFSFTLNTPSQAISWSGFMGVSNDVDDGKGPEDSFWISGNNSDYYLDFLFTDPTGTAFGGTSLPTAFPALYQGVIADPNDDDDLTVPSAFVSYYNKASGAEIRGSVLSITPSAAATGAVPEPASWALMIAGFGLVGGAMRLRRKSVSQHQLLPVS